jgi:hypothetical protein
MIIAPRTRRQHHAMGMERRRRDRGRPCLVQEAGVWLYAREFLAVEVEDFDGVAARSAVFPNPRISWMIIEREGMGEGTEKEKKKKKGRKENLHSKNRQMLMRTRRPQICRRLNNPQRPIHPNIPQLHLPIPARAQQLPLPPPLHMHALDPHPIALILPLLDHGLLRLVAGIKDADRAVAEAGHEDVARHLVRGERGDAGAGAGVDIDDAEFGRGGPDADYLDVAGHEQLAVDLLPVEDHAGINITGDEVSKRSPRRRNFDLLVRVVVAVYPNHAIRGSGQQERLIVFVDELEIADFGTFGIAIGEAT